LKRFSAVALRRMRGQRKRAEGLPNRRTVVNSRPLTEGVVNEFAKSKKLEEIVVSIARLSGLPTTEIERLFLAT
jgi:hypothetical protein